MAIPCQNNGCKCPHDVCDAGLIEVTYVTVDKYNGKNGEEMVVEKEHKGVKFCPECDPERAHIQESSLSREELQRRLKERSPQMKAKIYEQKESEKTRIL